MPIVKKTAAAAAPAAPAKKTAAKTAAPAAAPAAPAKNAGVTIVKNGKKAEAKAEKPPKVEKPAEVVVEGSLYRRDSAAEYIQAFVKNTGAAIPLKLAKLAIAGYEEFIAVCLKDGDQVQTSLGRFYAVDQPEREGRNPATGETITIEARRQPKLKISATLKKAVNGEDTSGEGEEGGEEAGEAEAEGAEEGGEGGAEG
jgi:DNA-binding protein HU-beta